MHFLVARSVIPGYYISLMDVAQNLIFITSYYIYFKVLMILFSFKWCLLKAEVFWKTMLVAIYPKILHHNFIPTIYDNFKSVFMLIECNRKFGNMDTALLWVNKRIKAILRYFHWTMVKKCKLSEKYEISCLLKTTIWSQTIFIRLLSAMKQLLVKFNLKFKLLYTFNFPCT